MSQGPKKLICVSLRPKTRQRFQDEKSTTISNNNLYEAASHLRLGMTRLKSIEWALLIFG